MGRRLPAPEPLVNGKQAILNTHEPPGSGRSGITGEFDLAGGGGQPQGEEEGGRREKPKVATGPVTQCWRKETDPCQSPLPDAVAKGKIWSDTEEVYYLK